MIYALNEALTHVFDEGLQTRFRRHKILAKAFREAMKAIGLKILAKPGFEADTVTAVLYPEGVEDTAFRAEVEKRNTLVAYGYGPLRGKSFRVGHMGSVTPSDVLATVGAIEVALKRFRHRFELGIGVATAQRILEEL